MKYKLIEVVALDWDDNEEDRRDFETVKEAREFIKRAMLDKDWWNRRAELDDYWTNITTVRLLGDGEVIADWFPFGNAELRDLERDVSTLGDMVAEDASEAAAYGDGPVGSMDRATEYRRAVAALKAARAKREPASKPEPRLSRAEWEAEDEDMESRLANPAL